jgi:hypothetical protein
MIISRACEVLDAGEARAAEALVLGRAGRLTPAGLRSAIARAVMQVAPAKARKRREAAAREARLERWAEHSGNAALVGRELPPAEVLAADQRVTAWARELKQAGLDGSMDELRARAYLDLLLGVDSRPQGGGGSGGVPPGFAARVNLTVPMQTLTGLAPRGQGPRSRRHAAAPDRDPARHLYRAGLPTAGDALRLRPQRPLRGGRPDVRV